jgi:hypothetical protein
VSFVSFVVNISDCAAIIVALSASGVRRPGRDRLGAARRPPRNR